jgi:hypothetical protein
MSFDVQIIAPQHRNAEKNILDKFEEASLDLDRAAASYLPDIRPILLVRLDEGASFYSYVTWAREYLAAAHRKVAGIVIIQSALAKNLGADSSVLDYAFDAAWRAGVPAPNLRLTIPTGVVSNAPPEYTFPNGRVLADITFTSRASYTSASVLTLSRVSRATK